MSRKSDTEMYALIKALRDQETDLQKAATKAADILHAYELARADPADRNVRSRLNSTSVELEDREDYFAEHPEAKGSFGPLVVSLDSCGYVLHTALRKYISSTSSSLLWHLIYVIEDAWIEVLTSFWIKLRNHQQDLSELHGQGNHTVDPIADLLARIFCETVKDLRSNDSKVAAFQIAVVCMLQEDMRYWMAVLIGQR